MTTTCRTRRRPSLALVHLLLALALAAITGQPAVARAAQPATTPDFAAIDAYVEREMQAIRLPGLALGIVQGDRIVHVRGFGVADPTGRPVTPRTPFHLASLGKSFTALAVLQLAEAGQVELDAPVRRYLPWFRVADERASAQITVRHLLNQTSGISGTASGVITQRQYTGADAIEQNVRALATAELNRPVGAAYEYANINYVVLGLIVQSVSGQPYATYIQQHIFALLAMRDAYLDPTEDRARDAATGHSYWFGVPRPAPLPAFPGDQPAGADSFSASAEDMSHYLIAHLNGGHDGDRRVLSAAGIATLHRPAAPTGSGDTAYAMGWQQSMRNGVTVVEHGGALFSFHTEMLLAPDERWGVIVLMNGQSFLSLVTGDQRAQAIAPGIVSMLHDSQPPAPPASGETWIVYTILLALIVIQVAGMAHSIVELRRWKARPAQRPTGWWAGLRHVWLPLGFNLAWGSVILIGLPAVSGFSLQFLGYMYPDVIATLTISAAAALGWGMLRTALAVAALRPIGARMTPCEPVHA